MVNNLRDLKKFLQLCRQQGVESIKCGDVEVHLGQLPSKRSYKTITPSTMPDLDQFDPGAIHLPRITTSDKIDTPDDLTPEQLLNWSVGGQPS